MYVEGVPYPNIIAGCDIILSKAGYGILSEAMRSGKPLILVERTTFPESPYLEQYAEKRGDTVIRCGTGNAELFRDTLKKAIHSTLENPFRNPIPNGVDKVAKRLFSAFEDLI